MDQNCKHDLKWFRCPYEVELLFYSVILILSSYQTFPFGPYTNIHLDKSRASTEYKDRVIMGIPIMDTMRIPRMKSRDLYNGNSHMIVITRDLYIAARPSSRDRGHFKNVYEIVNTRVPKISHTNKLHVFQCMGGIFCVEFLRVPLKFRTKYIIHTIKEAIFI